MARNDTRSKPFSITILRAARKILLDTLNLFLSFRLFMQLHFEGIEANLLD